MVLFALTEMQTREKSPNSNDRKCTMLTLAQPKAMSLSLWQKTRRIAALLRVWRELRDPQRCRQGWQEGPVGRF